MRLATGLHPDPLGELERSPKPPSRNRGRGPTAKEKGGKGRRERVGREGTQKGRKGERRERRVRGVDCLLFI